MAKNKEHPVRECLVLFDQAFQRRFHSRAPIVPGKDAKLAKGLLERYSLNQLREWMQTFFTMNDPFVRQSGYTFAVFASCIGKVIVAHKAEKTTDRYLAPKFCGQCQEGWVEKEDGMVPCGCRHRRGDLIVVSVDDTDAHGTTEVPYKPERFDRTKTASELRQRIISFRRRGGPPEAA